MALKLDITDGKGVSASYHRISHFLYLKGQIKVTLYHYVNQTTRDLEKTAVENNIESSNYEAETERIKTNLDALSAQLASGDESVRDEVVALSEQVNERVADPERPTWNGVPDTHYGESLIVLPFVTPLSLASLYEQLAEIDTFTDAESV